MSVVSSFFEWTGEPDQMDKLSPEKKIEFLSVLIPSIQQKKIIVNPNTLTIVVEWGGRVQVEKGDILLLINMKNYPSYITAISPWFVQEFISKMEREEENGSEPYSIACV